MKFNLDKIVRESVRNLMPYSSARDEYVADGSAMIFLDANENPYENGVNRYPDPQQRSLKELLAAQKQVAIDTILLGNGSDEVLDLLFRTFCEPGVDNIISLPPTYGMYNVLSAINCITNKEVPLTADFEPDVNRILETVDENSKILFLCSPNNPTANSLSASLVSQLIEQFNGLVVIDEAYIDFATNESWISKLSKYKNLVVTQTLSKAYGMAGIRLGICYASEEIINFLNKIKPPYNVNELTQQKAMERLLDTSGVQNEVRLILSERTKLMKSLQELSFIKKIHPSDANFILVKVDDATLRYKKLIETGVVVRNRSNQPLCENCLRITVGTVDENRELLEVLNAIK